MLSIGNYQFDINKRPLIMGILNVTPDSFSDGGKYTDTDKALKRVEVMIEEGADIIDVGGESTRPGYVQISDDEEISRIVPVIDKIKANFDVPVSADTYKASVAKEALMAKADMINDIWGLKYDKDMAGVIKDFDASVCIMHNRKEAVYTDFDAELIEDLKESLDIAERAGISHGKIVLDPGVGFAKTYEQNLRAINLTSKIKELGYPVLLGTSRKSVIGLTLDLDKDNRVEGTIATSIIGYERGCSIFRVHDVKENYRALLMARAILKTN